jgi:hypothetical protein
MRSINMAKWTTLREVGNLWAVKLTVLIPVVGYLILFNAYLIEYLRLSPEVVSPPQLQTGAIGFRLLCIYFGLCFIAAASVLYTRFCPQQIKQFRTPAAYVAAEREHLGTSATEELKGELAKRDEDAHAALHRTTEHREKLLDERRETTLDEMLTVNRLNVTDIMHATYKSLNVVYPLVRQVVAVLFLIGFGFLAIPSVEVFYKCSILLVRELRAVF